MACTSSIPVATGSGKAMSPVRILIFLSALLAAFITVPSLCPPTPDKAEVESTVASSLLKRLHWQRRVMTGDTLINQHCLLERVGLGLGVHFPP